MISEPFYFRHRPKPPLARDDFGAAHQRSPALEKPQVEGYEDQDDSNIYH
ncbi:MAG: hypothetical protein WBW93_09570 [Steroidobacteraceae bacterium]